MELVRKETGTAFDPRCVDALIRVLGQNVTELKPGEPAEPLSRAG
jgi:HD-GYP domain-containing protein (c-di-GMP phosphodiesterase class II)